ncbi:type VII secretion protein EccB [Nocardia sp. NPDC003693]
MPAQLTTRAQVNGYRFLLRRLDHALVRRDVRMLHDPMRAQSRSLISGAILALLVVAGCAILAFIKPQGSIGDANIVMGKDSGALYVVVRDKNDKTKMTLHPALNLASARLIAESADSPKSVKDSKLDSVARGPILGIPGAPGALPGSDQGGRSRWTLCDTVQLSATGGSASTTGSTTTAIAGELVLGDRIKQADAGTAILVTKENKTYLVYDGKKAEVDPQNAAMKDALNLSGVRARPISTGLLDAAVSVPALAAPSIPEAGQPGPGRLSGVPIGGVIKVTGMDGSDEPELYVVLAEGRQRISAFTAQVIRNENSQNMSEIKSVTPDVIASVPVVNSLPVADFPVSAPKVITAEDNPVACITWARESGYGRSASDAAEGPTDRATVNLLVGTRLPLSDKAAPVSLASTDTTGDRIDAVYVPPASGEFVRVTGVEPGSQRRDTLFYVTDTGIRYGIDDLDTAKILGLGTSPRLAPWAIIGELVPGPTLSKSEALVQHDVLPTK